MKDILARGVQAVLLGLGVVVVGAVGLESAAGVDLEGLATAFGAVSPMSGPDVLASLLLVGVVAIAGRSLYIGATGLASAARIVTSDPVSAAEFHLQDGAVEVEGTAEPVVLDGEGHEEPVEVTITAPTSRTDCLAYTWERKEKRRPSTGGTDTTWSTTGEQREAVPFYVVDDSGKVGVDPAAATLSLRPSVERKQADARDYEGRLHAGDTVHVYGTRQEVTDTDDRFGAGRTFADGRLADGSVSLGDALATVEQYVGAGSGGGTFKISDASERRTTVRSAVRGIAYTLGGLCLLVAAAFGGLVYF